MGFWKKLRNEGVIPVSPSSRREYNPLDWTVENVLNYLRELGIFSQSQLDSLRANSINGESLLTIAVNPQVVLEYLQIRLSQHAMNCFASKLAKFHDKVQRRTNPLLYERKLESIAEEIKEMKVNLTEIKTIPTKKERPPSMRFDSYLTNDQPLIIF